MFGKAWVASGGLHRRGCSRPLLVAQGAARCTPGSSIAPSAVQRLLNAEFLKGLDGATLELVTGAYQPRLSPCGGAGRGRGSACGLRCAQRCG